jgi:hypothetical protein
MRLHHRKMLIKDYFEDVYSRIIVRKDNFEKTSVAVGDHFAEIYTSDKELKQIFFYSISHLVTYNTVALSSLIIYCITDDALEKRLKAPTLSAEELSLNGTYNNSDSDRYFIFYQPWLHQIYLFDSSSNIAIYWVKNINNIPWWEPTFSFRIIFHWWSLKTPYQLIHSGAISKDGKSAFLFPAPSGSGKSTTTLQLWLSGFLFLGDDYLMIDINKNKVYQLYSTAKVEIDTLNKFLPELKENVINKNELQKQKAILHIENIQKVYSLPISGIIIPSISVGKYGIFECSKSTAQLAIAPTTLHHLPHKRETSFSKISKLVQTNETYAWNLPPFRDSLVNQFSQFQANE